MVDKCESCRNGYNGRNGNGYMPCGCSETQSLSKPPRTDKIYSVKASKPGAKIGGWRVKAPTMQGATKQVLNELKQLGGDWGVQVTELKNQTAALKKCGEEND